MSVTIGSARIDENGKATNGKPGDQTGKEVSTQSYYAHNKGWYCLRPMEKADKLAQAMKDACNNPHIGYDQLSRNGCLKQFQKYGALSAISTDCNTDCSALVRVCVLQAFHKDIGDVYTGNLTDALERSNLFEKRFKVTKESQLRTGDILITCTRGHTAIVIKGYEETDSYYPKYSETIDVIFTAIGANTDYTNDSGYRKRSAIAHKNGFPNYTGTYDENMSLIALAKAGRLKRV